MRRICIMGNSHVACWKQAWDGMQSQYEATERITFFGAGGYRMRRLVVRDNAMQPVDQKLRESIMKTSGGKSAIIPEEYDHFVIVGSQFGFRHTTPVFLHHGTLAHLQIRPEIDLVSEACLHQCIDDILLFSTAVRLRKQLTEITEKPVTIAVVPGQAEEVLKSSYQAFAPLAYTGYLEDIYGVFVARAQNLASSLGFHLLLQEPATMAYTGYTRSEFSRDGVGLAMGGTRSDDFSHMNREFGAICLKQMLNAL